MSEPYLLFVYGQLRRGQIGYHCLALRRRTAWLGRARIRGRLHDLGDYPGLVLTRRGVVHGEVLRFYDPALWPLLDDYEDCAPRRGMRPEYRRAQVELLGRSLRAWAYVYARPVRGRPVLASGGWRPCRNHGIVRAWRSSRDM